MNAEGYRQFEADLLKVKRETEEEQASAFIGMNIEMPHGCRDHGLKWLLVFDALSSNTV